MTPKWKRPDYTVTGWICMALVLMVGGTDVILSLWDEYPTISQYVTARWQDQPLFGYIVIGVMAFLVYHWFFDKKRMSGRPKGE